MFRKVFGNTIPRYPTRLRYLREYTCLREATNPAAQQATIQQYQQLANKYGLSVQQLTQLVGIYQLRQLLIPDNFPNRSDYKHHEEKLELLYRQSQLSTDTLQQFTQTLGFKYPEINNITNEARRLAANELYNIYFEGINFENLISPGYITQLESIYRERTTNQINKLKAEVKDQELLAQLTQSLESIFQNYVFYKGRYVGLIKSFVDTTLGTQIEKAVVLDQEARENQRFIQNVDNSTKQLSVEDQEYARNVDAHDFKLFLQELYEKEYQSGFAQNRFNEKGQKLVYESQQQEHHVLRYQILAAVFGGYFLYLFYRGDAYYSTILAVPAVAAAFFYASKQGQAKRAIPFVRQILKNTDNSYELVFEQNRIISRIENIQASQIKLSQDTQLSHNLIIGNPTDFGYHVKISDQSFIVPFLYSGNGLDFKSFINV